jgi:hypothetical protein
VEQYLYNQNAIIRYEVSDGEEILGFRFSIKTVPTTRKSRLRTIMYSSLNNILNLPPLQT